jgi:hypothetical protein
VVHDALHRRARAEESGEQRLERSTGLQLGGPQRALARGAQLEALARDGHDHPEPAVRQVSRESGSSHHDGAAAVPLGAEALEYQCATWRIGLRRASRQGLGAIRLAADLPNDARLVAGGWTGEQHDRLAAQRLVDG